MSGFAPEPVRMSTAHLLRELQEASVYTSGVWRHKKTAKCYRVLKLALRESDLEHLVVYVRQGGPTWVRPLAEFHERFEKVHDG